MSEVRSLPKQTRPRRRAGPRELDQKPRAGPPTYGQRDAAQQAPAANPSLDFEVPRRVGDEHVAARTPIRVHATGADRPLARPRTCAASASVAAVSSSGASLTTTASCSYTRSWNPPGSGGARCDDCARTRTDVPIRVARRDATPSRCSVRTGVAPNAESGAEVTSLSQESPAHPASLRDVLNARQDCGMRFADVRAVARWLWLMGWSTSLKHKSGELPSDPMEPLRRSDLADARKRCRRAAGCCTTRLSRWRCG
jgi:hypothetical protein